MQMWSGGPPAHAEASEEVSGHDSLTHAHADSRQVRVERADARTMADDDRLSPAGPRRTGERDSSGSRGCDPCAEVCKVVDACVETVDARAEALSDWCLDWLSETDRRPRRRGPELDERRRPGESVGHQSGPGLKPPERQVRARPQGPVESPRREAMPGERELQRPPRPSPAHPRGEHARRVERATVPAEESPSRRSGRAVGWKPGPALKTTQRAPRLRPEDPVGRTHIEPAPA
jgi:hypothetical protein